MVPMQVEVEHMALQFVTTVQIAFGNHQLVPEGGALGDDFAGRRDDAATPNEVAAFFPGPPWRPPRPRCHFDKQQLVGLSDCENFADDHAAGRVGCARVLLYPSNTISTPLRPMTRNVSGQRRSLQMHMPSFPPIASKTGKPRSPGSK